MGSSVAAPRAEVVVVGSVNADLVLEVARHPAPGETLIGGSSRLGPGGKGANQAVAAALRGVRVAMVGAVGDDPYAEPALEGLRAAGVDLSEVRVRPGATGLAVVTVDAQGENSIIVVPGANGSVTPERVDEAAVVLRAARVVVLQAEIPFGSVTRAARVASDAGVRVLLNLAPSARLPRETVLLADPLVVNEHEAADVAAWLAPGEPPSGDLLAVGTALAEALHGVGVPSVVVTLGPLGAVGADGAGSWHVPGRRVVARDTTGAGDAFVGAIAAALARGTALRAAAEEAVRVAAFSVCRAGAQDSYPHREDPLP